MTTAEALRVCPDCSYSLAPCPSCGVLVCNCEGIRVRDMETQDDRRPLRWRKHHYELVMR
jgi:hypothetical protein